MNPASLTSDEAWPRQLATVVFLGLLVYVILAGRSLGYAFVLAGCATVTSSGRLLNLRVSSPVVTVEGVFANPLDRIPVPLPASEHPPTAEAGPDER